MKHNKLVLEIGSGHRPTHQSDILVDKHIDNTERGGNLVTGGRPLIISDIAQLPFKNASFGMSICSHVLEHVDDPQKAVAELERVSLAGYIETPSAIVELLEPHRTYHKWYVVNGNDGLMFYKKQNSLFTNNLLEELVLHNFFFKLFLGANIALWETRLTWSQSINCSVHDTCSVEEIINKYIPTRKKGILPSLKELTENAIKKYLTDSKRNKKQPTKKNYDLVSMLQCSFCGGDIKTDTTNLLLCTSCANKYRYEKNIYYMDKPV